MLARRRSRCLLVVCACLVACVATGCRAFSGAVYQVPAVHVTKLRMVTTNIGWAVGYTGPVPEVPSSYVLRTTDAGQTWHRVSTQVNPERATFFLGRDDAWVLHWGGSPRYGVLDFTTNGGQTWSSEGVPGYVGGPTEIDFISAEQGWIVFCNNQVAQVLRTSDGGKTWLSVGPLSQLSCPFGTGNSDAHGAEPVRFVSSEVGWAVVDSPPGQQGPLPGCRLPLSETQLLQTTDGGFSWHAVSLPLAGPHFGQLWAFGTSVVLEGELPAKVCDMAKNGSANVGSLRMSVPRDKPCPKPPPPPPVESTIAGLPITSGPCATCGFTLVSQDSGKTWHGITGVPPTSAVFLDARFGWLVAVSPAIYSSADGGLDWTRVGSLPWVGNIESVTSPTVAWALGRDTSGSQCASALWMTSDGGSTWVMTNPHFSIVT